MKKLSKGFIVKSASLIITFLLVNTVLAKTDKKEKIAFEEITLQSPYHVTHPILAADILSQPGKELVTLSVDEESNRWLVIYAFNSNDNTYQIADKLILDKQIYSFDISEFKAGVRQHLYFMSTHSLMRYQENSHSALNKLKPIAEVSSIVLKENPQFITRGHFIYDLNSDNFDDFIIPDFNQTHLFIGQSDGQLLEQNIPINPQVRIFDNGATYRKTALYLADVNLDKYFDIVRIGEGELQYFAQDEAGNFAQEAQYLPIKSSISGQEWWDKRDNTGKSLDQSDLVYRKLEELKDVDNDGITDMVVRYTQSSGVLDRVNDYEVYLGKNNLGKLTFSDLPSSVIKADGTLTGLEFVDIDNDQKFEVLLAGFDIGLTEIIGALLAGSIDQNVFLFKMDNKSNYSTKPNISKEVELNFSLTSGQSGSAVVKLADINGDGFKDLLLSEDETLKIYLGKSGDKSFSKKSVKYKTSLPKDGNTLLTDDLNGDGKDDILIKYGKLDSEDLALTFKVLLAQ